MISEYLGDAMDSIASFAQTMTTIIVSLVTFPFILFFLLKDGEQFRDFCLRLFPKKFRDDIDEILDNMNTKVGSYIQGQIFVYFCIVVILFIGFFIICIVFVFIFVIVYT